VNNYVVITTSPKQSLDRRAEQARARALQQLAYYFGRAIPDLDRNGEADLDMAELTDAILEAAALRMLAKLQATDDTRVPRLS
jgi:hypothetical protein